MLSVLDFPKTRILNIPWLFFFLETRITIHSSYFQINQIKFIGDIIKVMQLNQIDWNSSDFLKNRILFMLSVLDFPKTRILNIPWLFFFLETRITIHSSYFQINQIKFIDDIIKVMQLNQIDWNSSDFLKNRIFTHISCYSSNMIYPRPPMGYQQYVARR